MTSESEFLPMVQQYLQDLGYQPSAIASQVLTEQGRHVDLVAYSDDKPYVVVEIKANKALPSSSLPEQLRFDPDVYTAQHYARSLKAPYFMLTNGTEFLWFTNDAVGRPLLLAEPVASAKQLLHDETQVSPSAVSRLLRNVRDYLYRSGSNLSDDTVAFVIYTKLLNERSDSKLEQALDQGFIVQPLMEELGITNVHLPSSYLVTLLRELDKITFSNVPARTLLGAIDDVFLANYGRPTQIHLPRWLADFVVKLLEIRPEDFVFDLYTHYGNLLAAVMMQTQNSTPARLMGANPNTGANLWTRIQQLILKKAEVTILRAGPLELQTQFGVARPTKILVAPPFGSKLDMSEVGTRSPENYYLQLALDSIAEGGRVVMIAPEGMLFTHTSLSVRKRILMRKELTAIISLRRFLPTSAIKGSVLVFDKANSKDGVFMGYIDDPIKTDTFNCEDVPQLNEVISGFRRWTTSELAGESSRYWEVQWSHLNPENLSVTNYLPQAVQDTTNSSSHRMVPLLEVADLIRTGSNILLNPQGDIPVLGPACIRPYEISELELGRTSTDRLPNRPLSLETGDVVINAIGTYRGAAAVIGPDFSGAVVSRHVLVVRPLLEQVLPEYLVAVLNSGDIQTQLRSRTTGLVIPAISKKSLEVVTIPLPPLEVQEFLAGKAKEANENIQRLRRELEQAQAQLENVLKGSKR